ncbi:hypothetical protein FKM82_016041 [Ascaphus truei]
MRIAELCVAGPAVSERVNVGVQRQVIFGKGPVASPGRCDANSPGRGLSHRQRKRLPVFLVAAHTPLWLCCTPPACLLHTQAVSQAVYLSSQCVREECVWLGSESPVSFLSPLPPSPGGGSRTSLFPPSSTADTS